MKYIVDPNTSINETLKKLKDGDTLYLKQGIYKEKLDIYTNNINIIGENKENTIITNNDYYETYCIIDDGAAVCHGRWGGWQEWSGCSGD